MRLLIPGIMFLCFLAGCDAAVSNSDETRQKGAEESAMEKISNAVFDGESITVTVLSNGCTKASHFTVEHTVADAQCALTVVRTQPDMCRKAPAPVTVGLAWSVPEDCADLPLVFKNPILQTRNRSTGTSLKSD